MAVIWHTKLGNDAELGVWERSEPLEWLESQVQLKGIEKEQYAKFKNDNRKTEWLTTRILLNAMVKNFGSVVYDPDGKPYLSGSNYKLSITHSINNVAVLLSRHLSPGIDIEHVSGRAGKVSHKFLSDTEMEWCKGDLLITSAWSAKESIYKMKGSGLDFKDIRLSSFEVVEPEFVIKATILTEPDKEIILSGKLIGPDVLTFGFYSKN